MKLVIVFLLVWLAWTQTGSLQIQPVISTLSSSSDYTLTYYTFHNLPASATFLLDFANTYISVPTASLNTTATVKNNNSTISITSSIANCSSNKCTLKLNAAVNAYQTVIIQFGALKNPYFMLNQTISATVTFNGSYIESLSSTIPASQYTPLPITLNSMTQSNYGVGNTEVTYTFNLTLPMTPDNPQLAVTLPSQIGISNLQTTLSYYNSIQNAAPISFNSLVLFSITTSAKSTPGTLLLTLSGLINPQAIGSSDSFSILLQLPSLPNSGGTCSNCKVALINSGLIARSTVAGNIITLNINSSNTFVGQINTLKVYSQLLAPIPQGGNYRINLPTSVTPVQPLNCLNVYGFSITSGTPTCSYNATSNSVSTTNFYVSGVSNVMFGLDIINPPDTRKVEFTFQTFDAAGNMIGNSSLASQFVAQPLLLKSTVAKNATEVGTPFKMTVNVTLAVALTNQDFIQVVLPPANYNTSDIVCSSGGIAISCTSTINPSTSELMVSMAPPCAQCSAAASLSFSIDKLTNPSFISSSTQTITIQTAHSLGIVEQLVTSIDLSASVLSVSGYNRVGNSWVGSAYELSFSFSIPSYLSTNGGQLILEFPQDDSYISPTYSSGWTFPSSLHIEDGLGNDYSNAVVYYSGQTLQSVMKVVVQICGSNPCSGKFITRGLSRGYYPLTSMSQTITLSTTAGNTVATTAFSTLAFNPTQPTNPLALALTNSVTTLSSNYKLTIASDKVPIQGSISFALSSLHTINGGCFAVDNSTLYTGVLSCGVLNGTVTLSFSGDMTPMMAETISYEITVTNVTNPPTVQPLTYSLTTSFNSQKSQTFSTTYSIENPLPLSLSCSRTNSTYSQAAVLTLSLTSANTLQYSEIKLSVPTNLMTIVTSSNYKSQVNNGAFIVDGIYSLSNNSVSINIVNPASTGIQGNVVFGMYLAGYLSAQGTVSVPEVGPVFLGLTASSSNRIVGNTTELQITVNRVNPFSAEKSLVFNLDSNLFNLTNAMYNGTALVLPLTLPITTSSFKITVLQNLLSVPIAPPQNSLQLYTLDVNNYKVAQSQFNTQDLVPNTPTTGLSYSFVRSTTTIGAAGALTVTYTPRFPAVASTLTIVMPSSQMVMNSAGCNIQTASGLSPCQVISSNATVIALAYSGQSQTILTDVSNIQPNANLLSVLIANTYGESVQKTSSAVTPAIELNQLAVAGNVSALTVASQNTVTLKITSFASIDPTSKIVIQLPTGVFLSLSGLNTQQCTYTIAGVSYSACSFRVSTQGWIQEVNLTNLGNSTIAGNSAILLTLATTNAWNSQPFNTQTLNVFLCNQQDNYLSKGTILITALAQASSFSPATLASLSASQSSTVANSQNNLTFSYVLPVAAPQNSTVAITIPKSAYLMNISSISSNVVPTNSKEDSNQYSLTFPSPCSLSGAICSSASTKFTFTIGVKNNQYVPLTHNPVTLQVTQGNYSISQSSQMTIDIYSPLTMGLPSISRSNNNANELSTVSISFTTPPLTSFTLVVSSIATPSSTLSLLNSITFVGTDQNSPLNYSLNTTGFIKITMAPSSGSTTTAIISGTNSFLVPIKQEQYTITLLDSSYIYYQSTVSPSSSLQPISSGLNLQRIVTTVARNTEVYLNGGFPKSIPSMTVQFAGLNYTISTQNFNVSLGNITNSGNVSDASTASIEVKNADFVAFRGQLAYSPPLQAEQLTSFVALTVPSNLQVLQSTNVSIAFTNTSLSYVALTAPLFFNSLTRCCIDSSCSQSNIASCSLTSNSTYNSITLYLKNSATVSMVFFTVTTIDYQTNVQGTAVVSTGLPSSMTTTAVAVAIAASTLMSTLQVTSWMVNTVSTYTLYIQPVNRTGYIGITIPEEIKTQIASGQAAYNFQINGSPLTVSLLNSTFPLALTASPSITNITLTLSSVKNPPDSQPLDWNILQSKDSNYQQIYSSKQFEIAMTQFNPITVSSVVRNATKVSLPVTVTANITTPSYQGPMLINFPISQLYTLSACTVTAAGQTQTCSIFNQSAILTTNVPGTAIYTISGLSNQKSFSASNVEDPVQVIIGQPYISASTVNSTTTYVTPRLTLGAITLQNFVSSNNIRLAATTLNYLFTIENTQNIYGFIINYSPYSYYIPTTITCQINQGPVQCQFLNNNSLLVLAPATIANQLQLTVAGMVNYIQVGNWSIISVKKNAINGAYEEVDVYYSSTATVTAIQPNSVDLRVMFPNNYAHDSPAELIVLIDSLFTNIPISLLHINLTVPQGNCQLYDSSYQTTLTLACTFPSPTTASLTLSLFHPSFASTVLAVGTKSIPILSTPTSNCNNQMCDSCSTYNGMEYCFACREGLYSFAGQCTNGCPQGEFPYAGSGVCQECFPSCSSCFGYSSTQCLSCFNQNLVLNSGTCQEQCPSSSFDYQGDCVQTKECTTMEGCRVCSGNGFCYQCLPDYSNAPVCTYASSLPPTLMIYILAPVALLTIISIILAAAKCGGGDSVLSQTIFSFSLLELCAWILTVPIMPNVMSSMVLLSFMALRLIISIVSYEVFYRHNLGELSQKLLEEESIKGSQKSEKKEELETASDLDNWKTKMVRFLAHFNGPDSYELLKSRISEPVLSVTHHFAVQVLFMINRWLVGVLMVYLLTLATFGDSLLMPVMNLLCAGVVTFSRVMGWDKFRACLNRLRP